MESLPHPAFPPPPRLALDCIWYLVVLNRKAFCSVRCRIYGYSTLCYATRSIGIAVTTILSLLPDLTAIASPLSL